MSWRSSGLEADHVLDHFDCGVEQLNKWLTCSARQAQSHDTARTYVWTERGGVEVKAYFAITPTMLDRDEDQVSNTIAARMDRVPAFLIAKLAVDLSIQGQGNGGQLLLDVLQRVVGVAELGGGRLIIVDAIDARAAKFYERHDFIPVKNNPERLVMKMNTARKVFKIGVSVHA